MLNPGRPSDTATALRPAARRVPQAGPGPGYRAATRRIARTTGLGAWVAQVMSNLYPKPEHPEDEDRRNPSPVYEQVTAAILAAMDRDGLPPWRKPWDAAQAGPGMPYNGSSGRFYRGANIPLLWAAAQGQGFSGHEWWTARQVEAKGGTVQPGAAGQFVIFCKPMIANDETGELEDEPEGEVPDGWRKVAMLRTYTVFHRDQCSGLPEPRYAGGFLPDLTPDERAESLIAGNPHVAPIRHVAGDRAFYRPTTHTITMPKRGQFHSVAEYYSTLFHECTHSTKKAMGRPQSKGMDDPLYAREELVAEMGAAFLCAIAGIENTGTDGNAAAHERFENSAAYLKYWRDRIAADPRLIITAAGQASAAVDYIRAGAPKWQAAAPAEADDQADQPKSKRNPARGRLPSGHGPVRFDQVPDGFNTGGVQDPQAHRLVRTPDGGTVWGELIPEAAKAASVKAAPIVLCVGWHEGPGVGFGLVHLRHGSKDLADPQHLLEVLNRYDALYRSRGRLVLMFDRQAVYIQRVPGMRYGVITGYEPRAKKLKKMGKPLWIRGVPDRAHGPERMSFHTPSVRGLDGTSSTDTTPAAGPEDTEKSGKINPPGYSTFPATANVGGRVLKGTFRRGKGGRFLPRDPAERSEVWALRVAQAWGIAPADEVGGQRLDAYDLADLKDMARFPDFGAWAGDRAERATARAERQAARLGGRDDGDASFDPVELERNPRILSLANGDMQAEMGRDGKGRFLPNPGPLPDVMGIGRLVSLVVVRPGGRRVTVKPRDERWLAWDTREKDLLALHVTDDDSQHPAGGAAAGAHAHFHGAAARGMRRMRAPDWHRGAKRVGLVESVTYCAEDFASPSKGRHLWIHQFGDRGERGHGAHDPRARSPYPPAVMPALYADRTGALWIRRRPSNVYTVTDWIIA